MGEVRYGPLRVPGVAEVYASPLAAAGRIYIASREGTVVIFRHGPSFEVIATNQLDDGFSR